MKIEFLNDIDIKYSEEDIKNLAMKLNWKGYGMGNDPIIIPSEEGLPQTFAILSSKLFIELRDCKLDRVMLMECQNALIKGCSFNEFGLIHSFNNKVEDSNISLLSLTASMNNLFIRCSIAKTSTTISKDNTFQDCIFERKARKGIEDNLFNSSWISKYFFLGILGIVNIIMLAFFSFLAFEFGFVFLVLGIMLAVVSLIIFAIWNKRKGRLPRNVIQNK